MTRELAAALRYAERAWLVFPTGPDKRPLVEHGFKQATTDGAQIRAWWQRWRGAGIGWAIPEGTFVLDIDARHRGHDSLADLLREHGALPPTLSQITGGGGLHLIFRAPAGVQVRQTAGELGAGIDTRAGGRGYIILPPSVHSSGARYRWSDRVPPVEAPAWLVDLVRVPVTPQPTSYTPPSPNLDGARARRYAVAALSAQAGEVASTPEGGRNARLFAAWARCTRDPDVAPYLSREMVRAELTRAALAAGLPEYEIARTLRDGTASRNAA